MELLLLPNRHHSATSATYFFNLNSNLHSINTLSHRRKFKFLRNPNRISSPLRVSLKSELNSPSNEFLYGDDSEVAWGEDPNTVEVIGIGSRKDAIIDFCLESPFESSFSSLRFWTIISNDESSKVQLQQRSIGKDVILRNMDLPASQLSAPRTAILVASAGYGLDHITAIELLGGVKSADGMAVGIVLKPFSFEGQRRQEEVMELVTKVREHTNFCIVVDTDVLLKKEVVTLAEALKSANNAVLLSINSIFTLMSERHKKLIDCPHNTTKELKVPELLKLFGSSEEARVGFGAGNNMKLSIARAVFDCPFITDGVKELTGVAVCTLACAAVLDNHNVYNFLHTFRKTTGWQHEIVLSTVHETNLEPNLFVTTIIVCGSRRENVPQRNGFFSGLVQHFPFVLSLLGRVRTESKESLPENSFESPLTAEAENSLVRDDMSNFSSFDDNGRSPDQYSDKVLTPSGNSVETPDLSEWNNKDKISDDEVSNASDNIAPDVYDQISEGQLSLEREPLIWWNVGPSLHIAEEWAKQRAAISGSDVVLDSQSAYTLPVGVKSSEPSMNKKSRISNGMGEESVGGKKAPSWDTLTDAGFEAVMDIYNATSTMLKGTYPNISKKSNLLTMRAASMLEVERDSEKKWAPTVEMQYRGGIYRGRCQGGLPEGKGCLTLMDGSIYDGMWRYGKKAGVGTFYYSNGDVFQGTWRDDLMHGKGWFYFHSGDRWFANFWKGKANGEGRFYSKDGEIFFGHFQDGWRHGPCLCISVSGVRYAEIWDEGVLLDRQQMDSK